VAPVCERLAGRSAGFPACLADNVAHKLDELERKVEGHDISIRTLFAAIRELAAPAVKPRREIGFHVKDRANGVWLCGLWLRGWSGMPSGARARVSGEHVWHFPGRDCRR
jgi:hypothetical protein